MAVSRVTGPPSTVPPVTGPRSRLARIRAALTPAEWTRMGGMALTIVVLHVAGWGMLAGASRRALPDQQHRGVRVRHRDPGLHAGHAARVRRRPHRGDRQHHPQAGRRGQAAAVGRVLVLARPLLDRVRAGAPAELRHPRAGPAGQQRQLGACTAVTGIDRHRRLRHVPVPDRRAERGHPGRHRRRCSGEMRNGRYDDAELEAPAGQARADEPVLRAADPAGRHAVEDVPDRPAVRARLRHRHRGRAAGAGGRRGGSAGCRSTRSCRCRSCSRPG